ncbi:lipase [Streptomyces sp. NPDC035033]|uniref:esterase/lipase family protein n=1 Tax=Streptomyces sp. NPDC035033 TaxID=3155368 RepID=UPI0033F7C2EC
MRRVTTRARAAVVAVVCALAALVLPAAPAQADTHDPVLFVHGIYMDGPLAWSDMAADFERAGWDRDSLQLMSYNTVQDLETSAAELVQEVAELRARTGADKVDIVAHSLGNLVARWYIKFLGGSQYVDDFVGIAGVNHGTIGAEGCGLQPSCQDAAVYSPFVTTLNSGDETPGPTTYTTLWSNCDTFVNPDSSARLDGANNIWVGCVDHVAMLYLYSNFERTRAAVS